MLEQREDENDRLDVGSSAVGVNQDGRKATKWLQRGGVAFLMAVLILLAILLVYRYGQNASKIAGRLDQADQRALSRSKYKNLEQIKNQDLSLSPDDHALGGDHAHEPFVLSYPTLGLPVVGEPFNATPICYQDYYKYQSAQDELFRPYKNTNCKFHRYGTRPGAGFILCQNFMDKAVALLNFGVVAGDEFGCSVTSSYVIKNYVYGCDCEKPFPCRDGEGRTMFERVCLSEMKEVNQQHTFTSLKDEIDKKGLKGKHIILKLDMSGAEWMGLKTLPLSYLQYIDQMVIVFNNPRHPQISAPLAGYLTILKSLSDYFVSVNFHLDNRGCVLNFQGIRSLRRYRSSSIELTLVSRRLIELRQSGRSYFTNNMNVISSFVNFDCQMQASDE